MFSRLGPWCHDRRRFVLGLWIALLVLGNAVAGGVGDAYRQDFSPDGLGSTDGFSLVQEAFPMAAARRRPPRSSSESTKE